ncbi:hypothetical protein QOT17_005161 [Balamuthia mandrillaris]
MAVEQLLSPPSSSPPLLPSMLPPQRLLESWMAVLSEEELDVTRAGLKILGVPVGTPEFMGNYVEQILREKSGKIFQTLAFSPAEVPPEIMPLQAHMLLVRQCLASVPSFWLRTVPHCHRYVTEWDESICMTVAQLLRTNIPPGSLQESILRTPIRLGGFGLRASARSKGIAPYAFSASLISAAKYLTLQQQQASPPPPPPPLLPPRREGRRGGRRGGGTAAAAAAAATTAMDDDSSNNNNHHHHGDFLCSSNSIDILASVHEDIEKAEVLDTTVTPVDWLDAMRITGSFPPNLERAKTQGAQKRMFALHEQQAFERLRDVHCPTALRPAFLEAVSQGTSWWMQVVPSCPDLLIKDDLYLVLAKLKLMESPSQAHTTCPLCCVNLSDAITHCLSCPSLSLLRTARHDALVKQLWNILRPHEQVLHEHTLTFSSSSSSSSSATATAAATTSSRRRRLASLRADLFLQARAEAIDCSITAWRSKAPPSPPLTSMKDVLQDAFNRKQTKYGPAIRARAISTVLPFIMSSLGAIKHSAKKFLRTYGLQQVVTRNPLFASKYQARNLTTLATHVAKGTALIMLAWKACTQLRGSTHWQLQHQQSTSRQHSLHAYYHS